MGNRRAELVRATMPCFMAQELFREAFYQDLPGGILEGFGRLLKHDLKIYVCKSLTALFRPYTTHVTNSSCRAWIKSHDTGLWADPTLIDGKLVTAESLQVEPQVQKLYEWIREREIITPINVSCSRLPASPWPVSKKSSGTMGRKSPVFPEPDGIAASCAGV